MPNRTSERSALIEHSGVGGSACEGTLYPIGRPASDRSDEAARPFRDPLLEGFAKRVAHEVGGRRGLNRLSVKEGDGEGRKRKERRVKCVEGGLS